MPWYKAGTVSVVQNSNAVIGASTAFIANARVGDAFRGPDGGWYEVTNIASDTALSIAPNYQGAANASGAYALAPMQGYVKDSADALRALVNQFGGVLAVLGTTATTAGVRDALNLTNADGLPEGATNKYLTNSRVLSSVLTGLDVSVAGAVVATDSVLAAIGKIQATKAAKGANTDITSLTGLTTALAVNQGGTGGNTQALARTGLGLKSASTADILGTVSQAAGVPTGALMEYGTNANGEFWKFACGLMICTRSSDFSSIINTQLGGGFYNPGINNTGIPAQDMPASFIAAPKISMAMGTDSAYGTTAWLAGSETPTVSKWPRCYQMEFFARNNVQVYRVSYMAIGRWF
ncbi:phage tail protein [Pseudomonas atagonensis]|uniref:phage tail protein n=1 Tax=Pseudomonas atagonensis TaxID=2609964 RepID=UPI001FE7E4D4|nr:phage tail protein [Pseudomonas atagonensis]